MCTICNSQFHSQRNLDRHISVVHDQNKPFECGACGLSFARRERLKQHIERSHQGDIIVETGVIDLEELKTENKPEAVVQTFQAILPNDQVQIQSIEIHQQ